MDFHMLVHIILYVISLVLFILGFVFLSLGYYFVYIFFIVGCLICSVNVILEFFDQEVLIMPDFQFSLTEVTCFLVFCCALFTSVVLLYRRRSQEVLILLQLIFELFYSFDIADINSYILTMFRTVPGALVPIVMVLMAVTGTLTVYLFTVFLSLIQRMLNREQVFI